MAINYQRLQTKLGAILAKDPAQIAADNIYLPFMGNQNSAASVAAWLKKRTDVLEDILNGAYTDAQITKFMDNVYKTLSASDKLIADKIMAGESYTEQPSDADNYEKLVVIMLYKFVMEP